MFHELATPILYHSIVIDDLPSLVKGLSAYEGPQTITRKTQRKDQLVAKTKHLRMVGFGPTGRPSISLGSLLEKGGREGRKRWKIVGIPLERGLELSREMAIQGLIDLQDHEDIDYPLRQNPAFTSLQTVVIGQRFDRGWDHLKGEILEMTNMQLIRNAMLDTLYQYTARNRFAYTTTSGHTISRSSITGCLETNTARSMVLDQQSHDISTMISLHPSSSPVLATGGSYTQEY